LPLAIELAAARIKLFPPRALLRRLMRAQQGGAGQDSPLRLLADEARDSPPRQQTLLRAISWSYDLLSAQEQVVFRRLSVFVGGCSIEAAEVVGAFGMSNGLDLVASLVDKSLVWPEEQEDGEPRLRMLETIREYAREQLRASDEADAIQARHAAYYLDMVERAALQLVGPQQLTWFARLELERDNLRAVERWASTRADADSIVRLGAALWPFWLARDDASESRERLEVFLALVGQVAPKTALAGALLGAGVMAEKLGDYTTCRALLEKSLAVARQLDDRRTLAAVLDSLGRQKFIEGLYVESRALLEESETILRASDDRVGLARVLSHLGFLEYLQGRPAAARLLYEEGLALAMAAEDRHRVAEFMDNLGQASEVEGDFETASRMFQDAIRIWRELGQGPWLAMALNNLGKLRTRAGELAAARGHLFEALSLSHRIGNRRRLAYTMSAVASLAAAEGDAERAAILEAIASVAIAEIGAAPSPYQPARPTPAMAEQTMTFDQAVEESSAWLSRAMTPAATPPPADGLTRREREVVALLAHGLTNRQVGAALVLTEGTVENYVQRILGKLGFNKRAQIAVWAVERGLGSVPATD
jgi:DNA-binding NarL/FixJ family response regulator